MAMNKNLLEGAMERNLQTFLEDARHGNWFENTIYSAHTVPPGCCILLGIFKCICNLEKIEGNVKIDATDKHS